MDKNSVIGMVLLTTLAFVYFFFFAPKPEDQPQEQQATEQVAEIGDTITEQIDEPEPLVAEGDSAGANADSLAESKLQQKYGDFAPLTQGEAKTINIKTDKLSLELNTLGGAIDAAYLNEYETYDSLPLPIIAKDPQNEFNLSFIYDGKKAIQSKEIYFEPSKTGEITVTGTDTQRISLKATINPEAYIEQVYTFVGDRYDVGYEVRFVGLSDKLKNDYCQLDWTSYIPRTEKSLDNMRPKSTVAYYYTSEELETISKDVVRSESEPLSSTLKWVSYKSQFFCHVMIADDAFRSGAKLGVTTPEESEQINKVMSSSLFIDLNKNNEVSSNAFTIYMGPNEYNTLRSYKVNLHKQMDLGWWIIKYINVGTVFIFKQLERVISSYGIIIILFALMVKMVLFPLTYRNYVSMGKLRVLNGTDEMKALDEKYKDDATQLQQKKMEVYRKMGVNPMGGCLPMLLQFPILYAMFAFFPQSVELRQQPFLWANDLSTYDSIYTFPNGFEIPFYGDHISLFTLLMAVSIYIYTFYNQKSQPAAMNNQFKYMAYIFPLFFVIFLNNYASGLSLYYLCSNFISIAQTLIIRSMVDDEKLLAQMREKKKSKKSGKKGRLERWMEAQQKKQEDVMRQQRKQGKGGGGEGNRKQRRDNKKKK